MKSECTDCASLQQDNAALQARIDVLEQQIRRDAKTGLLNHAGTQEELGRRIALAELDPSIAPGVIVADLDNFKQINDTRGHLYGDTILQNVAHVIRNITRPKDTLGHTIIGGRPGGDEFVLIVDLAPSHSATSSPEQSLATIQYRLFTNVNNLFRQENLPDSIGISLGGAIWEKDMSIEQLLDAADKDMYLNKTRQKNLKQVSPGQRYTETLSLTIGRNLCHPPA